MDWSKNTFGDYFRKKKTMLAYLGGIQRSPAYPYSTYLQNLKSFLSQEYNSLLRVEEDYWHLRSRINWLNDGDANTKFFHMSVLNRHRTNQISYFKDDNNNWITSHDRIIHHTLNYFQACFTTDYNSTNRTHIKNSTCSFHRVDFPSWIGLCKSMKYIMLYSRSSPSKP